MKQYAAKPIKRGKSNRSGYVCKFQIYTDKSIDATEKLLGSRIIVGNLIREIIAKHKFYFGYFFTSVELMISLKSDKILVCVTVRSNRFGLSKNQKSEREIVRGDMEYCNSFKSIC